MDYDTELANLEHEGISPEDIEAARNGGMENSDKFPVIVFSAAVTKDIIDIASLGTVGAIINIFAVPLLYLYLRSQIKLMRSLKKWAYKKMRGSGVAEFVPILNMVPWWSIMVYRTWQKKRQHSGKIMDFVESFAK